MVNARKLLSPRLLFVAVVVAALMPAAAQGAGPKNKNNPQNSYEQTNLVSDLPGMAILTDANLVNAWGISAGPTTPFWISDNGTGLATLYNVQNPDSPTALSLVVEIPPETGSTPTGNVFNPTSDFLVDSVNPARFIFATEDGTISAWSPQLVDSDDAVLEVDNSPGAVYKGIALGHNQDGNFIFAANFRAGTVDVFDRNFAPATLAGSFSDPSLPAGFAPFGIRNIGGKIYVTYALQDAAKHDDAAGPGNGFVDVYDTNGNLIKRLISNGNLNSPWGLALAPNHFGAFSHDLLVGNFGDGHINAYNIHTGALDGQLDDMNGAPITIMGLWGLAFGNGNAAGPTNTLFFTAGINGEADGLFGSLEAQKGKGKNGDMD
ncbi:MAG: TIGR03118 family protein [Dehalococcoidia bacterium]|jgi:uncharacterized protein (TIGR03118 family)